MSLQRIVAGLSFCLLLGISAENASAAAKDYAKTRYPIVFVGGFLSFDSIFGIEYFYGIANDLRRHGAVVFESDVSEFQTNETRGEELLAQIEEYLAVTGHKKVNLVGHSQGSPTARYVAAMRPDLVASVTSVHGMNRGTPIATFFKQVAPEGSAVLAIMNSFTKAMGYLWSTLSGGPNPNGQSASAIITGADPVDYERFNKLYPQAMPTAACGTTGAAKVNGVQYWSWGGTGGVLFYQTNPLDLLDTALYGITPLMFPKGVKHDGVVPLCGQYLGKPIRHSYAQNHTDAQNQLFGMVGLTTSPVTQYRDHANRLKKAGL